ncbi:HAD family phosphatase [Aestuariibacter sp. A3R04]|uniref:HAD family hydrolase n=1 Tax=Aestuariibacter sp. A3R04 TaxID=2841571 RepID=UPI001C09431E|nr:HAD family phosphatase [Aestuariibacter sp. A3R04]MBU3021085.1 HAD family phosphatase [Aestuariibacter sp. A3R04]
MPAKSAVTAATRAILFDHDGTLIDSEHAHFEIWQTLVAKYGAHISADFYSNVMAGIPVAQNAIDVVNTFTLAVPAEKLAEEKHFLTRAYLKEQPFPLMPHAVETLKKCYDAGFQLAIVTGGSGISVERTLTARGIKHMFSATVSVEDVKHSKPAPDCYQLAMKKLNRSPSECVAIEDTEHGMRAAVRAGVPCAVIPTVHSAHHDFSDATSKYHSLQAWYAREC